MGSGGLRDAERRLLNGREPLPPASTGHAQPPLSTLVAAARIWSPMTPRAGLVRLAERLPA